MKVLKGIASGLLAVAFCVSMALAPATALAAGERVGTYVFDERGLFTSTEFDQLEAQAQQLAS